MVLRFGGYGDEGIVTEPVLTRDEFALWALSGILANEGDRPRLMDGEALDRRRAEQAAAAYRYADLMLEARKRELGKRA